MMKDMPEIETIKRLQDLPGSERWGSQSGIGWRCWFEGYERRASKRCCPTFRDFLKMIGYYSQPKEVNRGAK